MDPIIDNEWLGCKNEPIEEAQNVGNTARSWQWREMGIDPLHYPPNKTVLENNAEDILVKKPLNIKSCDLPGYPRSTFLMVFSPDGTKVASTHANHNVYVSELSSGKHVRVLRGHPRTPWCIAFHPSHPQLLGSGCLGGQVRVWDIASGGSEVWNVRNETVIASMAFHPREQLLVIATYNELYFWDWSQPAPFTKVCTNNINEKVRYVAFDSLGYKLITGISLCLSSSTATNNNPLLQQNAPSNLPPNNQGNNRDEPGDSPGANRPQSNDNSGTAQDMIVNSYQNLVQRYDSLVRNYQRLFMVRHRLSSTPPPPPTTTDRGTDPMETDVSPSAPDASPPVLSASPPGPSTSPPGRTSSPPGQTASPPGRPVSPPAAPVSPPARMSSPPAPPTPPGPLPAAPVTSTWTRRVSTAQDDANPTPSTSRRQDEADSGGEGNSSRLLNLDVLSFESNPSTSRSSDATASPQEHSIFGSRSSAFQPLNERTGRSFRTIDQYNRIGRFLPNPFSSSAGTTPRPTRVTVTFSDGRQQSMDTQTNSSRTSIFTSSRIESPLSRDIAQRIRNQFSQHQQNDPQPSTSREEPRTTREPAAAPWYPPGPPRPNTTNSSTQMSPEGARVDAQTINESLDLIRDILRDSGTRLLNLITNMSLSTLASVERGGSRRGASRAQSDDGDGGARPRASRYLLHLLSSSSDSDSDEDSIFRRTNLNFESDDLLDLEHAGETPAPERVAPPTDRMVFDLDDDAAPEPGGPGSPSGARFHVRSQHPAPAGEGAAAAQPAPLAAPAAADAPGPSGSAPIPGPSTSGSTSGARTQTLPESNRTSTNRDNIFLRQQGSIPPSEAYRKVRGGVNALQRHTMLLTNLWLRGNRTTMRDLRNMWENLRRRIMMLHRETGRQDVPSYYTRSLLERCMILTEMSDSVTRTRSPRSNQRNEEQSRNPEDHRETASGSGENGEETAQPDSEIGNHTDSSTGARPSQSGRTSTRASSTVRTSPSLRRRLQSRWRPEDELRRRSRNPTANRLSQRYPNRSRRDFARAIEISATRHEIRMRAMQVLSVMFNMMMMCLEERGLSQLIINMLRTLKKALALTCLMLMTNRNNGRTGSTPGISAQRMGSLNVVRIQNEDHAGPVNVDEPEENSNTGNAAPANTEDRQTQKEDPGKAAPAGDTASTSQQTNIERKPRPDDTPSPSSSTSSQRWSNRVAVQIAAANRNYSVTARTRRDIYIEGKRQKALHRTNPTAHPLIKKRVAPPASTYRIPALRNWTSRTPATPRVPTRTLVINEEPIPGPSNENPADLPPDHPHRHYHRADVMNEFEHRVNLIRMAHLQAVRLRNAARNRFRRLQTIRLYTPSSVREMFALQSNNSDSQQGSRSPMQGGGEHRRPFATYRPHILTPREAGGRSPDEPHYHTVMNNVSVPMMGLNPANLMDNDAPPQPQRLPRIHEYLQPIILAQNAMVVEEEGGGGGEGGAGVGPRRLGGISGLLDAGIISEAHPVSSHRVQAWDFTRGDTPDIANNTKNVVVQRCRIHNDASIDISKDGRLLVALLPVPRLRNTNHWLGVYSLEWARLGQCLHTAVLEQSAVSVALSPTARHLAVGLGSRRFTTLPHARNNVFAFLYRLDPLESSSRTGLSPIRELEQTWEPGFMSLNCLRWAPQPGQGLVYANNTGQLIVMS